MRSTSARQTTKRASRLVAAIALAGSVLAAPILATAGAERESDPLDTLVSGLQAHYDDVKDITASFELENVVKSIGRRETAKGLVLIERPGRMRWQYSEPEAQVLALDGETFRMYVPSERQLTIAPAAPGEGGSGLPPTAFDFLLGTGKLDEAFRPELLDEAAEGERGLRLRPRDEASFEVLDLWVGTDDFVLRASRVIDLFGNVTVVRFREVKENGGLPPDAFAVRVPENTETIDLRPSR